MDYRIGKITRWVGTLAVLLIPGLLLSLQSPSAGAQPAAGLSGTLVVLNKNSNNASFIDLASGDTLATLPTGQGPHELAVTADGRIAVGTDYAGGNSLTVFDIENLQVQRSIDLAEYPRPHGILMREDQRTVLVTSEASNRLVLVDFISGEIVRAIDTSQDGSHMVAQRYDGRLAVTSNMGDDSVSVVNVQNGELFALYPVPARPEAIALNSRGNEIWVGSNDESVVTVLDTRSGEEIARFGGFEWPYRILIDANDTLALIPDLARETLRFFDVEQKLELDEMDFSGDSPQGIIFLPDEKHVLLSLSARDEVVVIDTQARTVIGRYQTGDAPDGLVYSPLTPVSN